jgi:DNA-binding protein Fis
VNLNLSMLGTIEGPSKTPQTASISKTEEDTMSAIPRGVRAPEHPDTATGKAPAPATLPFVHDAHDELRHYVERRLRLPVPVPGGVFKALMRALERLLLEEGTRLAEGNQSKACRILGISRPAFRDKLAKHGLLKQNRSPPPRKPR